MRRWWAGIPLMALLGAPLSASALPRLVTVPSPNPDGTTTIRFRIVDVTPGEPVGGANFEIPTDNPAFEVLGGLVLNPDPSVGDPVLTFNPTAAFRPSENDFFLSFFACRQLSADSCDFRFLTSDFAIAELTVRQLQAGPLPLNPASSIALVVSDQTVGVNLGGQDVLAGEPDADGDGVPDAEDNCPFESNADQDPNACLCGDVNGDGEIDFVDARLVFLGQAGVRKCDVNGDGECDFVDGRLVVLGQAPAGQCPAATTLSAP